MPPTLLAPNVPIVGQAVSVYEAQVSVTMRCTCHPDNRPFLLMNVDQAKVCTRCGNIYGLSRAAFDRSQGPAVFAEVSIVGRRAPSAPSPSEN